MRLRCVSKDLPSLIADRWIHLFHKHYTSIHWCLHRHTCRWLEAPAGPFTENLASTDGRWS